MDYRKIRVIISGGGTGGHIFPALSIAGKLKEVNPDTEILFVGAEGRMEMEKVPAAGFEIVGLPILGLQRQLNLHNVINDVKVPFKLIQSLNKAGKLIDSFKPDIAVGVGGYASAPLLWMACRKGVRTLIQEQNGFAGLTNRILGRKADCICVAYDGMERFFPAGRIVMTGNPIRSCIHPYGEEERMDGRSRILVVGGSLGSGTLNRAMMKWIGDGCPGGDDVEVLWQCGRHYLKDVEAFMAGRELPNIKYSDFIGRMDLAYAGANVIVSRSGASSISEICAAGRAAIFVPSPNVAEDHQTHNAMSLVRKGAGMIIRDAEAEEKLLPAALNLLRDRAKIREMEKNAASLARLDSAQSIVDEIYKLI